MANEPSSFSASLNEDTKLNDDGSIVKEEAFNEYYSQVKQIEQRDSVLTSKQQLDRLTRPGATYFNLNPFEVLQVDPDTPLSLIKQKYRRLSILVHPDKNPEEQERAQKCFEAVNKAWKTLENEEGYKRCQEITEEAKVRVNDMMEQKRKKLKKEKKMEEIPEDNPEMYKHAVHVQTCKLFADLERLRIESDTREMHDRKRKATEEAEEIEKKKLQKEWDKNFEETRMDRVQSWRTWNKATGKKSKGAFRPPKAKQEIRE